MRDNLPNMLRAAAKEWREDHKNVGVGEMRYDFALEEAADAIADLEDKLAIAEEDKVKLFCQIPRWIPVTERLPGTGEIVLVYGKRGGIYTAEHNRNARWPGTFWKLNSKSHHCEPTHWMPLPEPPKEG